MRSGPTRCPDSESELSSTRAHRVATAREVSESPASRDVAHRVYQPAFPRKRKRGSGFGSRRDSGGMESRIDRVFGASDFRCEATFSLV
jgi:hypothetical protein